MDAIYGVCPIKEDLKKVLVEIYLVQNLGYVFKPNNCDFVLYLADVEISAKHINRFNNIIFKINGVIAALFKSSSDIFYIVNSRGDIFGYEKIPYNGTSYRNGRIQITINHGRAIFSNIGHNYTKQVNRNIIYDF